MQHQLIRPQDWEKYPSRAYANWFSQLEGVRSPVLIGTQSRQGTPNLAIFNSMTHLGARPPILGFVLRPLTVERHTYENIKETGFYTINHFSKDILPAAHATSAKFERQVSEFERVGLSPLASGKEAPYVKEATVSMLLKFEEEHTIACNDTILIAGRVIELRIPETLAFREGHLAWNEHGHLAVGGLFDYYELQHLERRAYVKPEDV